MLTLHATPESHIEPPLSQSGASELPSAQAALPSSQTSQKTKIHQYQYDWIFIFTADDDRVFYMMSREKYKMTCTHNGIQWKCNLHTNNDEHKMAISYYRCSSKNCIQNASDQCQFRQCVRKCNRDGVNYVYRVS
jgi:hypothetical protein